MTESEPLKDMETIEQQRARFVEMINEAHDDADREGTVSSEDLGQLLDERRARRRLNAAQ